MGKDGLQISVGKVLNMEIIARLLIMLLEMSEKNLPLRGRIVLWALSLTVVTVSLMVATFSVGYIVRCFLIWFGG